MHYLDHACVGRPADATLRAVSEAVTSLGDRAVPGTERTLSWLDAMSLARARVADLLRARADDIALVQNTTDGLGLLASGLRLRPGDNILVPDIDFLSAALVWRLACERDGVELRPVRSRRGAVPFDAFVAAADNRTRVIVTSAVQELSGYRTDLEALADLAAACDAYLIVDGIQEAGVLDRDLSRSRVHAYVAGGHKWLGSPFGLGFLWMHPRLREHCHPAYLGYFNVEDPPDGWDRYLRDPARTAFDRFPARRAASVLESGGTPQWLGAVGLAAAADDLLARGIDNVERDVGRLVVRLRTGLAELGLSGSVLGGPGTTQSAIVTFGVPGGPDAEQRLLETLASAGVQVSSRHGCGVGGIRVSPHVGNTEDDVDALLAVTKDTVRPAGAASRG